MTDPHARARTLAEQALIRELNADEVIALDAHLRQCPDCDEATRALRSAHVALEEWGAQMPAPIPPRGSVPTASRWSRLRPLHAVAATLALGIGLAGFAAGRATADRSASAVAAAPDAGGLYALFLEEPEATWPHATDQAAYGSWADALRANDQFAGGMRLEEDEGLYVPGDGPAIPAHAAPPREVNFSGLFLVRASSYSAAVAMARQGPHGSSGGVLVRRVALFVDE